jgi:hypothetical protein
LFFKGLTGICVNADDPCPTIFRPVFLRLA